MPLSYELSRLEKSIEAVSKLLEKYASKPAQFEYYSTLQECFLALNEALQECELIYTEQHKIITRLELVEYMLLKYFKGQKS